MGLKTTVSHFLQPLRCCSTFGFIFSMTNKESVLCKSTLFQINALQWNHNDRDGVSNHWRLDCLFIRLARRTSQKTSKPRVTELCERNPQLIGWFPTQRASSIENVSIWWRHHGIMKHILRLMNAIKRHVFSKSDGKNHIINFSIDSEIRAYLDLGEIFDTPEYQEKSIIS